MNKNKKQDNFNDNDNEKIEKMCCGCEYASQILETEFFNCKKNGVVLYNYCCKKFEFDVLKRQPIRVRSLNREQYTPKDFLI